MDKGSKSALMLERMPHGGYVVRDVTRDPGAWIAELFASTSITEALQFIQHAVEPVPHDAGCQ